MAEPHTREELVKFRQEHMLPAMSTAYIAQGGVKMVKGEGVHLIDDTGRKYVDCVNNVCHVGHCHPVVVEAGQQQLAALNTNTRYLYDVLMDYVSALLTKFPPELCVVALVNSGSEANELALRIAKTISGGNAVITLDSAYHGNTSNLVDISPYKYEGKGGFVPPNTTYKSTAPNEYRGAFKGPDAGRKFAEDVKGKIAQIHKNGHKLAAFICETIQSCAGQVPLPKDYLKHVYEHARAAGGLVIADEVQVGFGRVGEAFWGFQLQDVIPDLVTLGKPIGNGFPMGAVVMTREVADRFSTGMEYFNTFGGNPVACAVGLAVLRVIETENLQQHALTVGNHLKARLRALQDRFELIGDVRGFGLFLGVELVRSRQTLEPATKEAARVSAMLREKHGFLVSPDGPANNVLKIKPPMCFSMQNADDLADAMADVLQILADEQK